MGWTYNMASIFFNFGTDGATAGEKIYYFDNVAFNTPLNLNDYQDVTFKVFPNPTQNTWNIQVKEVLSKVTLYDILGKELVSIQPNQLEVKIDASKLPQGLYFAKIETTNTKQTLRLLKN